MIKRNKIQKGDTVKYEKENLFKDSMVVEAKVVGVFGNKVLLDNGDTFPVF